MSHYIPGLKELGFISTFRQHVQYSIYIGDILLPVLFCVSLERPNISRRMLASYFHGFLLIARFPRKHVSTYHVMPRIRVVRNMQPPIWNIIKYRS